MKGRAIGFLKTYQYELLAFCLALVSSVLVIVFTKLRFPNDDQFILYRYIDNIASGHGFVFNLGERVLGSTTPLFTLVGAAFKTLLPWVNTPSLVAGLNVIFFSLSAVCFYQLSNRFLPRKFAILALVVFCLNLSRMIPEGMETPLFLLAILAFLNVLFAKRYKLSAVLLAIALLVRPDAGLIAVLVAIYWYQKKGLKWTVLLTSITILTALPWLAFSMWYFHAIIPQSLATKIHFNDIVYQTRYQALKVQLSHLSRIYWGRIFDPAQIPLQILLNLLPFLVLVGAGIKRIITRDSWLLLAIPLAYLVSYSISNPVMYPWYLNQVEPFWILLSIAGVASAFQFTKQRILKVALIVLILIGPLYQWGYYLTTPSAGSKTTFFAVGKYLKDKVQPGESIGMSNIGIVGYITKARVEDFIGLINNYAVNYYPTARACLTNDQLYVVPPALVQAKQPEWLIIGDNEMDACFAKSDWFKNHYTLEQKIDLFGVYKRLP